MSVKVPLLDLKLQFASIKPAVLEAMERVCDSQGFILGPEVKRLETAVAQYTGCTAGIGMSSGTDALLAALMALEIGQGDGVITVPFTFFATAGTIARTGARPFFVDIDPATFNLSSDALSQFIERECIADAQGLKHRSTGVRVRAIMPVHLFGQMADMDPIMAIARAHGLKVIEDSAQSIGAKDPQGRLSCSVGDVGCLSFFPTKNLGAFGDGGMCVTNDATLAASLRKVRVHGMEPRYYHETVGGNFRLDELQAAVLNVKLLHLREWTRARQENACFYHGAFEAAGLLGQVTLPYVKSGSLHVYNQFVIRAERRDALKAYLAEHGVGTEIYYPLCLHQQQCFADLGYAAGDFPESERAAAEVLALPIFGELTHTQLQYVVDSIAEFYASHRI